MPKYLYSLIYRFRKEVRPLRLVGVFHDIIMAAVALFMAHAVTAGVAKAVTFPDMYVHLAGFSIGSAFVFYILSMNRGSWRYASLPDLFAILVAAVLLTVGYTTVVFIVERAVKLPRAVPILLPLFLIVFLGAPRLLYRVLKERTPIAVLRRVLSPDRGAGRYVLVYGVHEAAEQFIRSTRVAAREDVIVYGIVDDRPDRRRDQVRGVRVLGSSAELGKVLDRARSRGISIEELIVADPAISTQKLMSLMDFAVGHGLKITKLPEIGARLELTSDGVVDPQPLNLNDLLGRREVRIDVAGTARLIQGKIVLVTGAGGSIGSEIVRQVASFAPRRLILAEISEYMLYQIEMQIRDLHPNLALDAKIMDVRDKARCDFLIAKHKPDVIFHAAALKHVPLVEANPIEGIRTNVLGTVNIADCARAHDVKTMIMISTDKAVNPTNVMGATKRAAEAYCQAVDLVSDTTRFKTVRFGNVLGSNGSVVPRFHRQIAKGGPVTVTHPEIVRYFMSIPEASRLVLQASQYGLSNPNERGKILVLDMGDPVKIDELARKMIYLAGFIPDVDVKVEYIGLRPGEKLFEELLADTETVDRHDERGFSVAAPRVMDAALLKRALDELRTACDQQNSTKAVAVLRRIVPEFRHDPALGNPIGTESAEPATDLESFRGHSIN